MPITNEFQASLVPDVGGAISISIFFEGRLESISLHFLYGLATNFPSTSTSCAKALHNCSLEKSISGELTACAKEIPSLPTTISIISVTPFFSHNAFSLDLIALDAFVISGWFVPTPAQNNFIPPPVPVLSITGVLNFPVLPKVSATTVA